MPYRQPPGIFATTTTDTDTEHTGGTRARRDRLYPYYGSRLCPYQSKPTRPIRVIIIRKGFKSICLWHEVIPHNILNQSAISIRFSDSLGSFKPSRQLAAVCHGCARITEAAVTVVPGYGHGCTRITNTRNRDTVSAISVHMLHNWHRNVNERNNTVSGPFNMTNRGTCTSSNTDSPLQ